jgi:hypothetical protein
MAPSPKSLKQQHLSQLKSQPPHFLHPHQLLYHTPEVLNKTSI